MSESETSICNKALTTLGANTIIALTDETQEALYCSEHYDAARDAVLEDNDWTFAMQTFRLGSPVTELDSGSEFATVDLHGYANAFAIPADMLRVVRVAKSPRDLVDYNDQIMWEIQGRNILCDAGTIYVQGVMRVTDPSFFPPRFVQCLVYFLAANLSLPITESPQRMETMMGRYTFEKMRAQSNDGRQGRNRKRYVHVRR